ncbi:carbohydrate kinase [Rhizobium sp. Root149]|uniref:ribokinase n=1 Tax=Rhizobium sp. Root149 TaxID=1736473 RepID=UPI00071422CF|nr:ribokinase [Rhizobium sp. Root149]KQZ62120.1 carbohydrate kinase [Rhizobium sp. Root149]
MIPSTPTVVVFGSLHYDIIVHGPGRPRKGETVTGHSWHPACGGKGGNQAVSAAKRGVRSAMIGAVADDEFGRALVNNLRRHGVDHQHVRVMPGAVSGMSVAIFDDEGDYGAVIVSGSNLLLSSEDVERAASLLVPGNILVLQNEVAEAANLLAAAAMKAVGGRVLLNAAPARPLSAELSALIDILVVNAIEAQVLSDGAEVRTLDDARRAARSLSKFYAAVVVTAGGAGVACVDRNGEEITLPALKVDVVSTHGAGDEFIGVLAASLLQGSAMPDALHAANRAAALLVSMRR